jgi:hypothetical protein
MAAVASVGVRLAAGRLIGSGGRAQPGSRCYVTLPRAGSAR